MRKTFLTRRWMALLLALAICLPMVPATFADDPALTIDPGSLTLAAGKTGQLTAKYDGAEVAATWTVEGNPGVATVDGNGMVTAVAVGTATVKAAYTPPDPDPGTDPGTGTDPDTSSTGRAAEVTATCTITVTAPPPALTGLTVTLSSSSVDMVTGNDRQLTANVTATPANADTTGITFDWTTSNGSVATVAGNGAAAVVTAVGQGTANITVTARCGSVASVPVSCSVTVEEQMTGLRLSPTGPITLERQNSKQINAIANSGTATEADVTTEAVWTSSDESVVTVSRGSIYARSPGEAKVTASIGTGSNRKEASIQVEVSGIVLRETVEGVEQICTQIELQENNNVEVPRTDLYGAAKGKTVSWQSLNTDVADYSGGRITGRGPGTTTITAVVSGGIYEADLTVRVTADPASTIDRTADRYAMKITDILAFSDLRSDFGDQAGGELSHITGLRVDTSQGTLYYKYFSEAEPGQGVAQSDSFYLNPGVGQKGLSDITFVPKSSFSGGTVTINYTAVSTRYQNYACRILLTVKPKSSASTMALSTGYNTPVQLNADEFERICQELNGVSLSSVTFTQPSQRQGTLYTNYISADNYGSMVSTSQQYSRRDLNDIWFVPAPGFTGTATVYYTARGTGSASAVYSGQITIEVRPGSSISVGGLIYNTANGGPITFDDNDFEDYRSQMLPGGRTLSHIQFNTLPDTAEGTLYYDYRSTTSTGTRATAGTNYYYGTRSPRLDRITFAPADDFTGTVRLPFTGWDQDGNRFSGSVEINVRGSSGSGDIRYTCSPGRSVSFSNSDFTALCRDLTGRTLNYIVFQELPDRDDEGSLYHNTSRVSSTGTRYYNNSGTYRISRLSFKAASGFFGSVDIPFVGYATNGDSFNGVITIDSSGVTDWTIHYSTPNNGAAVFDRDDFDSLSQWDTREDVSSVRFSIPSTSQGDLYRNYYSTSSKGTRISSSSTSISASSLDRVAFVPNKNFTGTVYIDFTATAAGGGGTFEGTVEITVDRASATVTAQYSTRTRPVQLDSQDLRRSGYTLRHIQFTSLPSSSMGYLYYRYASPLQHESVSTGTTYWNSGSSNRLITDLTFVPRAGFTGTVILPYTGTNTSGSTFDGEVIITVNPTYSSAYFQDMSSYDNAQRAAVDFLRENGITDGMSPTQYGPEYSIRRGDFAKMVYQAFELNPSYTSNIFTDVPNSAYYAQAVNTLYDRGIVGGVGNGRFDPEGTLTRQDAVCMIQRAMRAVGMDSYDGNVNYLYNYSDGSAVGDYAQGAMSFAMQKGYLPISNGQLAPHQPLTRVDMAQLLHRVLTY